MLEAMANAGDGNYRFIESAKDLPEMFMRELDGLSSIFGRNVRLKLEGLGEVEVDVLNDFTKLNGDYCLPNLLHGLKLDIGVKLSIPNQHQGPLLKASLTYSQQETTMSTSSKTLSLPVLNPEEFESLVIDEAVMVKVKLLEIARRKLEGVRAMDRGDIKSAIRSYDPSNYDIPAFLRYNQDNQEIVEELERSEELKKAVSKDSTLARKRALSQRYAIKTGIR